MAIAVNETDDFRVPVRDGKLLSARVWMPETAQKIPAILEILPYRRRDGTALRDATTHAVFAPAGYACFRVDLRGTGDSEGLFDDEYSEQELSDVEDVISWIAAQPWCNGKVGIMGISWGGFNGLQVAARQPKGLAAVISLCATTDRFADDIHYKGGCELTENIGWAATATSWMSMPPDPAIVGDSWRETWHHRLENTPNLAARWARNNVRDAYWKHGSICEDYAAIKVPVLSIGGWHDGYRNTPFHLLANLDAVTKIIVGPWNHKYPHIASPGPQMDFTSEALRWWGHWLRGDDTGIEDDPAARLYLMDGIAPSPRYAHRPGKWVTLDAWPSHEITAQKLHLTDGNLSPNPGPLNRYIKPEPRCGEGYGEYFPFGFGPGELPDDQNADDALSVSFNAAATPKEIAIVGAPEVKLRLSGDQPFGQIALRLSDIAPDGAATLITAGMRNLQFRDNFEVHQPLIPGETDDVVVALDHIAYQLPAGHHLRLAISGSYWPFIWPEPAAFTLHLTQGEISIPVLPQPQTITPNWAETAAATPPTHRQTRQGKENKQWVTQDGRRCLKITADHGELENLHHGLRHSSALEEVWSINPNNISTPQAQITWDRAIGRDDFSARTKLAATMAASQDCYTITITLTAYDDEDLIFNRTFQDTIHRYATANDGKTT